MSKNTEHREEFKEFVINESDEPYRSILTDQYSTWDKYNHDYFMSEIIDPPYITLSSPNYIGHLGAYCRISDFGGGPQIMIRPGLLGTRHRKTRNMTEKGKQRFIHDVLLHQMVHQYLDEVVGLDASLVHLHTAAYVTKCNEIGWKMGLEPVGLPYPPKNGPQLPSAMYWPQVVRPYAYYEGAYEPRKKKEDSLDSLVKQFDALSLKKKILFLNRLRKVEGITFDDGPPAIAVL